MEIDLNILAGPGEPLEKFKVSTLLGIRFWDFVSDAPVTNGLHVAAYLKDSEYPPVPGRCTRSGVFAFQGLPGLRQFEYPTEEADDVSSPPWKLSFLITVKDKLSRFLPTVFGVDLPLDYKGIFLSFDHGSPPGAEGRAYLFAAPTRVVPPGMAAVRVDLWNRYEDKPAAHAVVHVEINGSTWRGVADHQGRTLTMFPYPVLERLRLGSPPGRGQGAIFEQIWPVKFQVLYQPENQSFPFREKPKAGWPWMVTPSLKSILQGQASAFAFIWPTEEGPPSQEWTQYLTYGEELLLRTGISSRLLISRGASPP